MFYRLFHRVPIVTQAEGGVALLRDVAPVSKASSPGMTSPTNAEASNAASAPTPW